ncbi:hypothetical protein NVV95_14500 [Herbiconiux sp. CPCC 205716]|uniref:Secreted protein n=1 Tax=Herbiconiux gentiana TaxID=2970912 RepID=A0ABT2GHQ5_9MICO|nr:hypothetical protein [Herbiconiux gentiana]MCS5715758.1 hypothetical protein [Herbiconiux gentiana]
MPDIDRRSVLAMGAWSVPVVAAAVAAPAAAASTEPSYPFALILSPESATTFRDVRSNTNLSIMNTSTTEFRGTTSVIVSGMYVQHSDNYLLLAINESPQWAGSTRQVYSPTNLSWSGTLAPGAISNPVLLQPLSQHMRYPTVDTISFNAVDEGAAPASFAVTWY